MPKPTRFDSAYFRKFYLDRATRVTTRAEMARRARLIAAVLAYTDVPVRTILDAGCGIGMLRTPLLRELPRARYKGLEASEYLCSRYSWVRGSVADYHPRQPSDLVICYDVLQYLPERDASRAIANLSRLCRYALYVSALTREDWRDNCDQSRTDRNAHIRPTEWYRRRLKRHFNYLGFGVWLKKGSNVVIWDMERPG